MLMINGKIVVDNFLGGNYIELKENGRMKNTLSDLNNYLFEQLERLNDELSEEELEKEIKRSETVTKLAKTIIDNGQLALQTKKHLDEYGQGAKCEIPLLGIEKT